MMHELSFTDFSLGADHAHAYIRVLIIIGLR